jgi:chitin disaccharide deacetylase
LKRLIVNADDFGFTEDVNEGIIEAHRHGILTACTLMANGYAFENAVELARETPSLDVGCHLTFVQGRSVLDPSRQLPRDLKSLLWALMRGELPLFEEAAAQVRKLHAAGIHPSHIDTHKHTHLLPPVLDAVSRVAREFDIQWVRGPFDFAPKSVLSFGIRMMRPRFLKVLAGLRMTDHFAGFQLTGSLNETTLAQTLKLLPEGLTEFMCHPGRLGSELENAATRLKKTREVELAALISPGTRRLIERHGIELVNYRSAALVGHETCWYDSL